MTTKKNKTKKRSSGKGINKKTLLKKSVTGLSVLVLIVLGAGFLAHYMLWDRQSEKHVKKTPEKRQVQKTPVFEIYPKEEQIAPKPELKLKPALKRLPRVAIIIDDIGYERRIAEKFLALDAVLTFSVFPNSPFQKRITEKIRAKGLEIMLHLPMEPYEYPEVNPGPDALFISMSPDELINQLNKNIDAVPFIKGVNNHMGSKMTTESAQMYQIFSVLKKRGLFFVDSRTTSKTICRPSARLLQIPFAQRDVFIDHVLESDFIRKQIRELIHIAIVKGTAVGIAHPHSVTYEVFSEMLPELKKKVQLVPVSQLVNIPG